MPGHLAHERDEPLGAELVAQRLEGRSPVVHVGVPELALVQVQVVGPGGFRDRLELLEHPLEHVGMEHVVKSDVGVRLARGVAVTQLGKPLLEGVEMQEWQQGRGFLEQEVPTLTYAR